MWNNDNNKKKAKVGNFLRLKVEEDRHINTTLLSSTAFANPHIYSKLVSPTSLFFLGRKGKVADSPRCRSSLSISMNVVPRSPVEDGSPTGTWNPGYQSGAQKHSVRVLSLTFPGSQLI